MILDALPAREDALGFAPLQAPFPWFGGKSRVSHLVWDRLGPVPNYVEPFFGSGAVLLNRPHHPGIETVNDMDGLVANFWRAIVADASTVAKHADWPVNENDLHARHAWLVQIGSGLRERLEGDPDWYDPKVAGWWVWGICCWIGSEFCSGQGPWSVANGRLVNNGGQGVHRQRPHLGSRMGVHRQRPHLGDAGMGVHRQMTGIYEWFTALQARMRHVRVCCGDWSRVCGPSPTVRLGLTGVFLDPPYGGDAGRTNALYRCEDLTVAKQINEWCCANGKSPNLRIALCGYEGEHDELTALGWDCLSWKAKGGYSNIGAGAGRENTERERIWFSPACLAPRQRELFD